MKKLILLFILLPFVAVAQKKGTYFEHGLSWQQVKEKAKKENKYLFVDCFTTWCGPCKYMTNNIFPQEKVGDFFNKNFVNVKVQFDKTKNDSEEVKQWYADAEAIGKQFKVRAYPTFLIFSPKGELVHRIVAGGEADEFIAKAQKSLSPETQYYTLLAKNQSGIATPEDLMQLANAAGDAYEEENASKYTDAYLATQKDLYTKTNLEFLINRVESIKGNGFEVLLKAPENVKAIIGAEKVNEVLANVILKEHIYPSFKTANNIDSLIAVASSKYPSVDITKSTGLLKVHFYLNRKKWDQFENAVLSYMTKYGAKANPDLVDFFARKVFENCDHVDLVTEALKWSKRNVEQTEGREPEYLSTYANLLYKSGKKKEAIATQQRALNLVSANEKDVYQSTLDKMKSGK